ncbi:MAG: PEP-CTERM sorting domain-containing protein [Phycisphaerales bacterium]|nr:MAG: PEP-CTERM sorting domain-containing protein [Phycisphaerales bacterium]
MAAVGAISECLLQQDHSSCPEPGTLMLLGLGGLALLRGRRAL